MKLKRKDYFIFLVFYTIIFLFLNSLILFGLFNMNKQYINMNKKIIVDTIREFHEIDLSHICKLTKCTKIYNTETKKAFALQGPTGKQVLRKIYYDINNVYGDNFYNTIFKSKDCQITSDLNHIISIDDYNLIVVSDSNKYVREIIFIVTHLNLFIFILFTIFFIIIKLIENKRKFMDKMELSNTVKEKNMKVLTENIHHELNTPVAIIHGVLDQFKIDQELYIDKVICNNDKCNLKSIEEIRKNNKYLNLDFETIFASIDQINTVLQRMNGFKQIRYSNGNKSMDDIISYSLNAMTFYKRSNFTYYKSPIFKDYSLGGTFSNGDFLNIFNNFIRNSLEAKSTFIRIDGFFKKDKMHIFIIDNGEGIYNKYGKHLQTKQYSKVFEPYYSTKDDDGKQIIQDKSVWTIIKNIFVFNQQDDNTSLRGVGLYLNKELSVLRGGDIKLKETSTKGTVFELIVPSYKRKDINEK